MYGYWKVLTLQDSGNRVDSNFLQVRCPLKFPACNSNT